MATGSGRGPIKVGSGYIDIEPKLSKDALTKLRTQLISTMESAAKATGTSLSQHIGGGAQNAANTATRAFRTITREEARVRSEALKTARERMRHEQQMARITQQAEAARLRAATTTEAARRREAAATAAAQAKISAEADKKEAARLRLAQERERTRRVQMQETTRLHNTLMSQMLSAARAAEQERLRILREERAAERAAHQQRLREIREELAARRSARLQGLREQLADLKNQRKQLQQQLRAITNDHQNMWFRIVGFANNAYKTWDRWASGLETWGTKVSEFGRNINQWIVTPLMTANSLMASMAIGAADSFRRMELNLKGIGAPQRSINKFIESMQRYAVETPYALTTFQERAPILARAIATNDPRWRDKSKRPKVAAEALQHAENIMKLVGDNAALSGLMETRFVDAALNAIEQMISRDKITANYLNQLDRGMGVPVGTIATLLGYDKAEVEGMEGRSPAAKLYADIVKKRDEGGVSGYQLVEAFSKAYEEETLAPHGTAAKLTQETFTGQLQQIWEQINISLGRMLRTPGKGGKESQLTPLGEALNELIDSARQLARDLKDPAKESLTKFFEYVGWVADQLESILGWLKQDGWIQDLVKKGAELAVTFGPLILAVGVLAKTLGLFNRTIGKFLATGAGVTRFFGRHLLWEPSRAGIRTARQTRAAWRDWTREDQIGSWRRGWREERARIHGGDQRSLPRRMRDWVGARVATRSSRQDAVQRQIDDVESRIQRLQDRIRRLNSISLSSLASSIAGPGPGSVNNALRDVEQSARRVADDAFRQLQRMNFSGLRSSLAQLGTQANTTSSAFDKLKTEANAVGQAVQQLNNRKLGTLRAQQVQTTEAKTNALRTALNNAAKAVEKLNAKTLAAVRKQVTDTTPKVTQLRDRINDTSSVVTTLNRRSLSSIRNWFRGAKSSLYNAVNDVFKLIGTSKSSNTLSGRITLLNQRSLKSIIAQARSLKNELQGAETNAKQLDDNVKNVNRNTGLGGGGSKKPGGRGHPKHAGGILPGYKPGVDSIPAILSPGEAILRPEVARILGPDIINAWNEMAIKGRLDKFAKGGIAGDLAAVGMLSSKRFDMTPIWQLFNKTIDFVGAGLKVDRRVRTRLFPWGANRGGGHAGRGTAAKMRGTLDYFTRDMPNSLKRSGPGALLGILTGAIAPIAGDYFWQDVWKGEGTITTRAVRFMKHLFSVDTFWKVSKNLISGITDPIKGIWETAKSIVTDPIGTAVKHFKAMARAYIEPFANLKNQVEVMKKMRSSPREHAGAVLAEWREQAEEALPNTKGLWGPDTRDIRSVLRGIDLSHLDGLNMNPPGDKVKRWTPLVQRVLKELGLSLGYTNLILHRIRVESGGNPKAINLWDSNAKAGHPSQGLMQTIPSTFFAYAGPYRHLGITNPLANIYAGLNYAIHRYGRNWPRALAGTKGYANGAIRTSPGLALVGERGPELVAFRGGERVFDADETRQILGPRYEIHIHEAKHEDTTQATIRALRYVETMYGRF